MAAFEFHTVLDGLDVSHVVSWVDLYALCAIATEVILEFGVLGENFGQTFQHDWLRFTSYNPDWIHVISLRGIESSGGERTDRY